MWRKSLDVWLQAATALRVVAPLRQSFRIRLVCKSTQFIQRLGFQSRRQYSDEVEKASEAASRRRHSKTPPTIFERIIDGEIPADIIYKDDKCMALHDVNPVAPVHFLVIPLKPIAQLSTSSHLDNELLGHLMGVVRNLAAEQELEEGYRVVINDGKHGAQSVYHLHIHVMGGRQMTWPPG